MKSITEKKEGATLLEVIISIFIFSLIMVSIMQIFGSSFLIYRKARITQKNVEEGQHVINEMTKVLRTSSIVQCFDLTGSNDGCDNTYVEQPDYYKKIRWFNHSNNICGEYEFFEEENPKKIISRVLVEDESGAPMDFDRCKAAIYVTEVNEYILSRLHQGRFTVFQSRTYSEPEFNRVGRVVILFRICESDSCVEAPGDQIWLQNTVTLRDYEQSGVRF